MKPIDLIKRKAREYLKENTEKVLSYANDGETKTSLLRDIKNDDYTSYWIISEVMLWEDKALFWEINQMFDGYFDVDYSIWKLYGKYVKVWNNYEKDAEFVQPKKKIVEQIYFE